ncbi:hypothetical protein [Gloeocapsa sp. PCC 73106]|uniref:TolB family protein n=1 Tax=Gloeocapsa sp. PCC 73106 TaxID=102232 RepID=UPI0002ABDD5A|nr:hypothetical protein [Gloeocapsa sp. PCC 73106]ELR99157.1 hypothetical protein GLO73106DRAFT_00030060 [Gloeocapsa sp. PCC 73106]
MTPRRLPIDRFASSLIVILGLVIAVLIWGGKSCGTTCLWHNGPKISYFSWENKLIGAEDVAFILGFDRPMDRQSVEANLRVEPDLSGKISWSGRRLAYTLNRPVVYGQEYQIHLSNATGIGGESIQPFGRSVRSRDRAFAYIGTTDSNLGKLILYNWSTDEKSILTPDDLIVTDFQFYPQGEKILFAAAAKSEPDTLRKLQLYTVTTGLNGDSSQPQINLILNNQEYQNNQFDLSADGQKIVVQRIKRDNPLDFDLWLIETGKKPKRLNTKGGEFIIAPDSQTLAVAQGEGISLISLVTKTESLSFLPQFGQVLSFSRQGSAAAMINFNTDNAQLRFTRSLFYVNNQGIQTELLNTTGSIVDCQFNPNATYLYCLMTELIEGEYYQEHPYFAAINLTTKQIVPLLKLDNYHDINISMAPDGLGILFDQVITSDQEISNSSPNLKAISYLFTQAVNSSELNKLRTNSGAEIIGGNLWLLIVPPDDLSDTTKLSLEELPFVGFRPQWSP